MFTIKGGYKYKIDLIIKKIIFLGIGRNIRGYKVDR